MNSKFRFAHISDLHVPPMPSVQFEELLNKRVVGYLSWQCKRKKEYHEHVLETLLEYLATLQLDHICMTGDLVNIGLQQEFEQSVLWIQQFQAIADISLVPGNHDAYVPVSLDFMHRYWDEWVPGEFPAYTEKDGIALIGLSSAVPTLPFMAFGKIDSDQLANFEKILQRAQKNNLFTIVMLHHPPQQIQGGWHKGLHKAKAFREVIARVGADLILHGHLHKPIHTNLVGPGGARVPVYGVGSASLQHEHKEHNAHFHVFNVMDGAFEVGHHYYDESMQAFTTKQPK